jgi:hypothetical protein
LNGLEVKWVRLAWTRSDRKNADGPTGTAGTPAGTPARATGNTAGKDRRRYGWNFGTRLSSHLQSGTGMGLSLHGGNGK